MVTISRIRIEPRPLQSLRWKVLAAFLLIVGLSFGIMAPTLTNLVSDHLYQQRIRQDSLFVEKLAAAAAPLFMQTRTDALHETLSEAAADMGARLMAVDLDGKIQADTFGQWLGRRTELDEVLSILQGGETSAFGIHQRDSAGGLMEDPEGYAAVVAAALTQDGQTIGALLAVTPVTELVQGLSRVQKQLTAVFLAVAAAALFTALIFSRIITRPIYDLTASIRRMAKGDLSARVQVRGSGEMRELAQSYNAMAQQLETIDLSRSQFVQNASHELKTPLATMKILLQTLLYQPDMPPEVREEFMQDMDHEIDRLTGIITDLLTLTQGDSHDLSMRWERVNLSDLAEETLRLLLPRAQQRNQSLLGEVEPGCVLTADRTKLGQILYNLVDNALKYTQEGGHVVLSLRTEAGQALIQVQDDGAGIPPEDQAHIFERFYRVDKARSRESGGTGLGLSIVRQMVLLHAGQVQVDSTPGEGSLFTVRIPLGHKEERP